MPLVQHLREGFESGRPNGWHRDDERRGRGLVEGGNADSEAWERELAWTEILVLSGSSSESFAHWARAWGRDDVDGFHAVLSQFLGGGPSNSSSGNNQTPSRHHHRLSTVDWGTVANSYCHDQLAADILNFSGEFVFDNLEQDIESLTSGDEDDVEG